MKACAVLAASELRAALCYCPETGVFTWAADQGSRAKAGAPAGHLNKRTGYLTIRVAKRLYQAHRLAWLWVHGCWPADDIDHINGVRADNRIANLRDVINAVNRQNTKGARADSATGIQGVSPYKKTGRYQALVRHQGRSHYLGSFDDVEAARAAYVTAKRRLHEGWVPPAGESRAAAICAARAPAGLAA